MEHRLACLPVTRFSRRDGFALATVVVVTSLAMVLAGGCFLVAFSAWRIAVTDASADRALSACDVGCADALERLRWGWLGSLDGGDRVRFGPVAAPGGGTYSVEVRALAVGETLWPAVVEADGGDVPEAELQGYFVTIEGRSGNALRNVNVLVTATPTALPRGVAVVAGASFAAPATLRGCGLYAGGDVRGRECVGFERAEAAGAPGEPGAPAADLAYPALYESAAVHAGGAIYRDGVEEHGVVGAPAADTDSDHGGGPPDRLVRALDRVTRADLGAHAVAYDLPAGGGVLDVSGSRLHAAAPGDDTGRPGAGCLVVTGPGCVDDCAFLTGARDPVADCPLTVVIVGDCTVGGPSAPLESVCLRGQLIVTGTLTVAAPLRVTGNIWAGSLYVYAPLVVELPAGRVKEYGPGVSNVHIASWYEQVSDTIMSPRSAGSGHVLETTGCPAPPHPPKGRCEHCRQPA